MNSCFIPDWKMFQITQNAFKMVSPVVHSTSHDIIMTKVQIGAKITKSLHIIPNSKQACNGTVRGNYSTVLHISEETVLVQNLIH